MLALLRTNPNFRRLFFAHATSRAGDAFNNVALVVLVFQLTGSGRGVATTVAFEVLPILALGPLAGLLADRYPRRGLMILADLLRAGLAAGIALSHSSVAMAFVVAFGLSVGGLLFNPAASAALPEVVEPDDVVDANAALWTVAVVLQILLAPLAGLIISWAGVGLAFGLNAASYVGSALWLRGLKTARTRANTAKPGWSAVSRGWATVRNHPLLSRLLVVQVLASLSAGATSGLLVVLAKDRLRLSPSGFGALLAAIGVGAALGPLLLRRFIKPGDRRWLFGPYVLRGTVDLALSTVTQPVVAGGALALYGVGTSTGMIAYQSTLQTAVPADVRGRAFAVFDVAWNAARLLSLGLGGLLADAVSVRAVYAIGGVLLLVAAGVGFTARDVEVLGRPRGTT